MILGTSCRAYAEARSPVSPVDVVNSTKSKRNPNSLLVGPENGKWRNFEMLTLGINYIYPMLKFQHRLSRHWVLGLTSLFEHNLSSLNTSIKGYAIGLGANYYFLTAMRGAWIEVAPVLHLLKDSSGTSEVTDLNCFSVLATGGWRWAWTSGFNLGVGVGAQYFVGVPSRFPDEISRLQPAFVLDVGFSF